MDLWSRTLAQWLVDGGDVGSVVFSMVCKEELGLCGWL